MLHVHCGDGSADAMKAAKPPGRVMVWCDLLHDGPLPSGVEGEGLYPLRGSFLARASGGGLRRDRLVRRLRKQDEELGYASRYRELIFWFDSCLFDMCHLMRHMDWLDRDPPGETRVSLICIAKHPSVARFKGLGQLQPAHFLELLPYRQPASPDRIACGARAWRAFRSANPTGIQAAAEAGREVLPVLSDALLRHLQQFPSTTNGLSQSEQYILESLAAGPQTPGALFRAVDELEARPFLGDTTFFWYLNRLLRARHPAVATANGELLPSWRLPTDLTPWTLTLTDYGRRLLAGDADSLRDNGIDRWLGGCRLRTDSHWRWDPDAERLVAGR